MSGLDKNRFRNTTISFRVSPEERLALEARIKVCGIPKGEYFIKSLLFQRIEISVGKYKSDTRIRAALHSAPEPYKEVFLWRALGGLSFRTIGQLFGKSENWACVTYHRAKTIIRKNMEGST